MLYFSPLMTQKQQLVGYGGNLGSFCLSQSSAQVLAHVTLPKYGFCMLHKITCKIFLTFFSAKKLWATAISSVSMTQDAVFFLPIMAREQKIKLLCAHACTHTNPHAPRSDAPDQRLQVIFLLLLLSHIWKLWVELWRRVG